MLLAFGSDYNIFAVGSVWDEARGRPLGEAIVAAMPAAVSALLVAGLALASSFGLLAVVPLMPFRELALAMFVGIMLDVLVVRSLLVPALLTLFGRLSAWPRRRLMSSSVLHPQPADSAPSTERAAPPTTRRGDGPG